ncbi:MAG: Penicillin amidase family protein, partial [uncultured Gemmatimonadetes bacterium]
PAHQGPHPGGVPPGAGAARQLVQRHGVRGRGREHRLLPPALHPAPRRPLRLHAPRGRERPGHRLARTAHAGRVARGGEPRHGVDPEHQQHAVFRVRGELPPPRALRALHGHLRRERARTARPAAAARAAGVDAAGADRRGVRPAHARFRPGTAAAPAGVRRPAGGGPAPGAARRAGGRAARVGPTLERGLHPHFARHLLRHTAVGGARRPGAGRGGARPHGDDAALGRGDPDSGAAPGGARLRRGAAGAGIRQLANAVGRDQPLPADHGGRGAPLQRRGPQPPGGVHPRALGLAGLLRGGPAQRQPAVVRHQRQQLRRRGGVRGRLGAGARRHRGRRERRSRLAALQRPGGALRDGPPARRLLLPGAAARAHGARVPPGRV